MCCQTGFRPRAPTKAILSFASSGHCLAPDPDRLFHEAVTDVKPSTDMPSIRTQHVSMLPSLSEASGKTQGFCCIWFWAFEDTITTSACIHMHIASTSHTAVQSVFHILFM